MQLGNFIKKYYPLIILFMIIAAFNICINIEHADFLWFLEKAKNTNIFDYLSNRYFTWTSRLLIEFVLVGILKFKYTLIFKIVNTLVMFFIPVLIIKIFCKDKSIKTQFLVISLYLCYNFRLMDTAGWYATFINYMWPLLCLLVGLIPIKNYIDNKKEKWYLNVIYILNIIFACNQEQSCAILFGVYLLFLIYTIFKKKISKFSILSLVISISSLIFILTCPGNSLRSISETADHYPEYISFGFVQKIYLCFSTIMTEYLTNYNVILFIFCLVLAIIIFKSKRHLVTNIISLIPIGLIFLINYSNVLLMKISPKFGLVKNKFLEQSLKQYIFDKPKLLFILAISIVFLVIIIYLIINVLRKKEKFTIKAFLERYYILLIFMIGMASRLIIGFSSSVFISGFRTNMFFDFSIIISLILILNKYSKELKKEAKYIIYLTSFIGIINIISIFIGLWR